MSFNKLRFSLLAAFGAATVALTLSGGVVSASDDDTTSSSDYPYDLHNHNRAIGFGSIQLAPNDNVDEWKKLEAYDFCGYPIPGEGSGDSTGSGSGSGSVASVLAPVLARAPDREAAPVIVCPALPS